MWTDNYGSSLVTSLSWERWQPGGDDYDNLRSICNLILSLAKLYASTSIYRILRVCDLWEDTILIKELNMSYVSKPDDQILL